MSCRVFGRQLENEAMNIAVETVSSRGVRLLRAEYIPTERNGVVRNLFRDLGFTAVPGSHKNRATTWILPVADYVARSTFIRREGARL
jgi:predicted enzyme involved in methoxymalonyl-ACP biosynthesis